jgi:hypothetical protein
MSQLLLDIIKFCNLYRATNKWFLIFKIRSFQWDTITITITITIYTYSPSNRTASFMIRSADVLSLNTTSLYRRNQLHVSANVGSHRHQFITFFINFMKYYSWSCVFYVPCMLHTSFGRFEIFNHKFSPKHFLFVFCD